jgi:hypothetical protein
MSNFLPRDWWESSVFASSVLPFGDATYTRLNVQQRLLHGNLFHIRYYTVQLRELKEQLFAP